MEEEDGEGRRGERGFGREEAPREELDGEGAVAGPRRRNAPGHWAEGMTVLKIAQKF